MTTLEIRAEGAHAPRAEFTPLVERYEGRQWGWGSWLLNGGRGPQSGLLKEGYWWIINVVSTYKRRYPHYDIYGTSTVVGSKKKIVEHLTDRWERMVNRELGEDSERTER